MNDRLHTVGYRCPEVLYLEDTGPGIVFSKRKKGYKDRLKNNNNL